jgi:hypothetical protein
MGTKEVRDPARAGEEAAAPSAVRVRHGLRERTRKGTLGKTRIAMVPVITINARAPGFWR